jgi:hypothetical protein
MFLPYSLQQFPWPTLIANLIDESDLSALRDDDLPLATVAKDSESRWHRAFYDGFFEIEETYISFARVIADRVLGCARPVLYQRIPTFRVSLPGNKAVGEFHRDSDYGHQIEELNVWTPCTKAFGSNSIHLGDEAVSVVPGEVLIFRGSEEHGNLVNATGVSRVSFDFRLIRQDQLRSDDRVSYNMGTPFSVGEYWGILEP